MGAGNSSWICINDNIVDLQENPFFWLGLCIELMIFWPLAVHTCLGRNWQDVVSISETWRESGMPIILGMILLSLIVVYNIAMGGCPAGEFILLWLGCVLAGLVTLVNPSCDDSSPGIVKTLQKWHGVFAFLLFSLMMCSSLSIVSTTFVGTSLLKPGWLIVALMICLYIYLFAAAIKTYKDISPNWCAKTSLCEILFCTLFGILLALIPDSRLPP
jgi:hypothetical protein